MSDYARVDQWIKPDKIFDAHLHTFTYFDIENNIKRMGHKSMEEYLAARKERMGRLSDIPSENLSDFIGRWVNDLDKYGVDKAMILPGWNSTEVVEYTTKNYPDRFIPFMMINPKQEGSIHILEEAYAKYGIKGFKLYPPLHYFHAYEDFVVPFYEFANDHNMLITYHMGISIGASADLRYMNPSDISPVARDFKNISILLAHFGTGYLRELLFLMYHVKNVYAETSSSNRWMDFMPYDISLKQTFERVIKASDTEHLVFGTDSSDFPRGWRHPIFNWQISICNEIGLNKSDINNIFYKNLERLVDRVK